MTEPRCLQAALIYAGMGWQVVPLNWPITTTDSTIACSCRRARDCASPGKHPWIRWRDHGGVTDPAEIRRLWNSRPRSGVAILTGPGRSGMFVVDIDPDHHGLDTIAGLESTHGPLPATLTSRTGGDGRHLVFVHPGAGTKQGAGDLGPGVDTRDHGGIIVAPPSLHRSGRRYRWENWGAPLAATPHWLLDLLQPRPAPPRRPPPRNTSRGSRYGQVALERTVDQLKSMVGAVGVRNNELNRAAWRLGRLVGAGLLDASSTGTTLLDVALILGLGQVEAEDTIASGLAAGARTPRRVPA